MSGILAAFPLDKLAYPGVNLICYFTRRQLAVVSCSAIELRSIPKLRFCRRSDRQLLLCPGLAFLSLNY